MCRLIYSHHQADSENRNLHRYVGDMRTRNFTTKFFNFLYIYIYIYIYIGRNNQCFFFGVIFKHLKPHTALGQFFSLPSMDMKFLRSIYEQLFLHFLKFQYRYSTKKKKSKYEGKEDARKTVTPSDCTAALHLRHGNQPKNKIMTGKHKVNTINIMLEEAPVLRSVYFFHVYATTRAYISETSVKTE